VRIECAAEWSYDFVLYFHIYIFICNIYLYVCVRVLYLHIQTGTSGRTLKANLYVTSLIWHKCNGFCILISNNILILNGLTWYKLNLFSYSASFRKSISH